MAGELETTQIFSDEEQVTSTKLNNIISQASFTEDAVTGTTLTVVGGKLKVGTITSSEMGANSVTNVALATDAVTTLKIADTAVHESKLGSSAVSTVKLANGAVTTIKIADDAVSYDKISASDIAGPSEMAAETTGNLVASNQVKNSPGVAKAYGVVSITNTSRNLASGSYNTTSATRISATETTVTIGNDMANANYIVQLTYVTNGTAGTENLDVTSRSVGSFNVKHNTEGSAQTSFMFVVYGQLA